MKLKLNSKQNELLLVHTSFYMLSCSIGFSAYVTGAFSMNLKTSLFDHTDNPYVFFIVISLTVFFIFGGYFMMLSYFQWNNMIPKKINLQNILRLRRR